MDRGSSRRRDQSVIREDVGGRDLPRGRGQRREIHGVIVLAERWPMGRGLARFFSVCADASLACTSPCVCIVVVCNRAEEFLGVWEILALTRDLLNVVSSSHALRG